MPKDQAQYCIFYKVKPYKNDNYKLDDNFS